MHSANLSAISSQQATDSETQAAAAARTESLSTRIGTPRCASQLQHIEKQHIELEHTSGDRMFFSA